MKLQTGGSFYMEQIASIRQDIEEFIEGGGQ